MACGHEIASTVLAGTDQVSGLLLFQTRHGQGGDLVQSQQLGQMQSIAGIGLDPVAGWSLQL